MGTNACSSKKVFFHQDNLICSSISSSIINNISCNVPQQRRFDTKRKAQRERGERRKRKRDLFSVRWTYQRFFLVHAALLFLAYHPTAANTSNAVFENQPRSLSTQCSQTVTTAPVQCTFNQTDPHIHDASLCPTGSVTCAMDGHDWIFAQGNMLTITATTTDLHCLVGGTWNVLHMRVERTNTPELAWSLSVVGGDAPYAIRAVHWVTLQPQAHGSCEWSSGGVLNTPALSITTNQTLDHVDLCVEPCGESNMPLGTPASLRPTMNPTTNPSNEPSGVPSLTPTQLPTAAFSTEPTFDPSRAPSQRPSLAPSYWPSRQPTQLPTRSSLPPSLAPSGGPSDSPTRVPTWIPSLPPSSTPSVVPSANPSEHPTQVPSLSQSTVPSRHPSMVPTEHPNHPTQSPYSPSVYPSTFPSTLPSRSPSRSPNSYPSNNPSMPPTVLPSSSPSVSPHETPSSWPSNYPSVLPTRGPTVASSTSPSWYPTKSYLLPSSRPSSLSSTRPTDTRSLGPTLGPILAPSVPPSQLPSISPTKHPSSYALTSTPSRHPTDSPSFGPSMTPSKIPSSSPLNQPSQLPTDFSDHPSVHPSVIPSNSQTLFQTLQSESPSMVPTAATSNAPTNDQSFRLQDLSVSPTELFDPSEMPTTAPSEEPSKVRFVQTPTISPSIDPSESPITTPTLSLGLSSNPTFGRLQSPSPSPFSTRAPSFQPSGSPSAITTRPVSSPTPTPTHNKSLHPVPTDTPSFLPSSNPSTTTTRPTKNLAPTLAPTSELLSLDQILILSDNRAVILGATPEGGGIRRRLEKDDKECDHIFLDLLQARIKSEIASTITLYESLGVTLSNVSKQYVPEEAALVYKFDVKINIRTPLKDHDLESYVTGGFDTEPDRAFVLQFLKNAYCPVFASATDFEVALANAATFSSSQEPTALTGQDSQRTILVAGSIAALAASAIFSVIFVFVRLVGRRNRASSSSFDNYSTGNAYQPNGHDDVFEIGFRRQNSSTLEAEVSTLGDPTLPGTTTCPENEPQEISTNDSFSLDYDYQKPNFVKRRFSHSSVSESSGTMKSNQFLSTDDDTLDAQYVAGELFEVYSPPGVLGLVLETRGDGIPVVQQIKSTSILRDVVQTGDCLLSVDGIDVLLLNAAEVSRIIANKKNQSERRFMFSRPSKRDKKYDTESSLQSFD